MLSNIRTGFAFIWRANKQSYLALVGASVLAGAAAAGIPVALAWMISIATSVESLQAIAIEVAIPPLLLLVSCVVVERLLEVWRSGALDSLAHDVRVTAEEIIVRATASLDLEDFDRADTHDRITRATQAAETRPVQLAQSLLQTTSAAAASIGTAGAVLVLQPALFGLALLTFVPAWYLIQRRGAARLTFIFEATPIERRAQYLFSILTSRDAAKDMRANCAVDFVNTKRSRELNRRRQELEKEVRRVRRADLVGLAMSGAAAVICWGVMGVFLLLGSAGIAEVLVFVYAFQRLSSFLARMSWGIAEAGEAGVLMSEVNALRHIGGQGAELTPDTDKRDHSSEPLPDISLTGVSYHYPECVDDALHDVTVRFERGTITAVVGPNGSGKTTLVKTLSLLLRPSQGRVTSGGDEIAWSQGNRRRLSVVFQDSERFAFTFRENVELGRGGPSGRSRELIEQVGLQDAVDSAPAGVDTLVGREFGGTDLSGGQWQRLLIARGIYLDGVDALILDEASSGLDPVAEYELMQAVRIACRDKIGIVVSHRLSSIVHADFVHFMDGGRIVESGPPQDLLKGDGPFARMFNVQARATGYLNGDHAVQGHSDGISAFSAGADEASLPGSQSSSALRSF